MKMLNNKGQSLVMFVLIIPIIILIFTLVIDIGNVIVNKQELDNINYLTIEYGLDHIDEDDIETKLINMVNSNDNKVEQVSVVVRDDKINISITKKVSGIFIEKIKIFNIKSNYKGYIENDKKIIERV